MERLHNCDIKIHKCEMTPEIFARLHASRLIGFLLKLEFNHVRREECKNIKWKHYLSSNRFCLYFSKDIGWRNCLLRPESWSWSLHWRAYLCVCFFFNWFDHRQILNTSTLDTRIQFTQFPSINQKPFVDGRRVAKKGIFRQFLFFGLVFG